MATITQGGNSSGSDNESILDVPTISMSTSSPIVTKSTSIDISTSKNVSSGVNTKSNVFPLDLVLMTSNKSKIRLQMTELEPSVFVNVDNEDKDKEISSSKQVKFFNGDEIKLETKNYRIGELVILQRNKQGLIRYIGELHNDTTIWYGIEMIGGNKGYHNGSFQGTKYFTVWSMDIFDIYYYYMIN